MPVSQGERAWSETIPILKLLIVEQDLRSDDMAQEFLAFHGFVVCGIACNYAEAIALGFRHRPDLAVVDLQLLDGERGTDIAGVLRDLGRTGILYTGSGFPEIALTAADGEACVQGPCRGPELVRGLQIAAEIVAQRMASAPFPSGSQVLDPAIPLRPVSWDTRAPNVHQMFNPYLAPVHSRLPKLMLDTAAGRPR